MGQGGPLERPAHVARPARVEQRFQALERRASPDALIIASIVPTAAIGLTGRSGATSLRSDWLQLPSANRR